MTLARGATGHMSTPRSGTATGRPVIENFIESYHTTYAHKRSIGRRTPPHSPSRADGHDFFSIHSNSYKGFIAAR
jgi:hypothetical protein